MKSYIRTKQIEYCLNYVYFCFEFTVWHSVKQKISRIKQFKSKASIISQKESASSFQITANKLSKNLLKISKIRIKQDNKRHNINTDCSFILLFAIETILQNDSFKKALIIILLKILRIYQMQYEEIAEVSMRLQQDNEINEFTNSMPQSPIQQYFHAIKSNVRRIDYGAQTTQKIHNQLQVGSLNVNGKSKKIKEKNLEQEIEKLQTKKKQMLNQLQLLMESEEKLLEKRVSKEINFEVNIQKPTKEEMDMQVKKVLQAQHLLELKLIKKKQQWLQWRNIQRLKEKQEKQASMEKQKQLRRHLIEIKMQQKKKKIPIEKQKIPIMQSYLFFKKQEQMKKKKQNEQKQRQIKLSQIQKRNSIDIKQIKQHQKRYEQRKNEEKQKTIHSRVSQTITSIATFSRNRYNVLIDEQMNKQKQAIQQQLQKKKQKKIRQSIIQFQQRVDKHFRPYAGKPFKPFQKHSSQESLSKKQVYQKGLQYLDVAKRLKKASQESQKSTGVQSCEFIRTYKDYLPQIKPRGLTSEQLFQQLSSRPSLDFQTLQKAKSLASSLQFKTKKSNDTKAYQSACNKLKLLQKLY